MSLDEFGTDIRPANPRDEGVEAKAPSDDRNTGHSVQWTGYGDNRYTASGQTWGTLPRGVYTFEWCDGRFLFRAKDLKIDNLFYFPDSLQDQIVKEIENFWDKEPEFSKYGFCHRRGYLLYGPQGSGKSSVVQQVIQRILDRGGIVFICDVPPNMFALGLSTFRGIESDRQVLCIFEDIDAIIREHSEADLLALLDGESEVSRVLNIATTNYPETLDKRIVSRPRRFDRVIKVGMPEEIVRRAYFKLKLPDVGETEIESLVKVSEGFSFAALAELIISVKVLGVPIDETVKILQDMQRRVPNSSNFDGATTGFKVK